jgi:hypothetical protein
MKEYIVNVYKVIERYEVTTLATNNLKAREMAIDAVKEGILEKQEPNCSFVAIEFDLTDRKKNEVKLNG